MDIGQSMSLNPQEIFMFYQQHTSQVQTNEVGMGFGSPFLVDKFTSTSRIVDRGIVEVGRESSSVDVPAGGWILPVFVNQEAVQVL